MMESSEQAKSQKSLPAHPSTRDPPGRGSRVLCFVPLHVVYQVIEGPPDRWKVGSLAHGKGP